jgi:hypothetical protein
MIGHAFNVLHHRNRILENSRVDALQDDALFSIAIIKRQTIRIVNMPAAARIPASESSLDFERTRDCDKAAKVDHRHSPWG